MPEQLKAPETVLPTELQLYAKELLKILLPEASFLDLTINYIHRLPKLFQLPHNILRDIIMQVLFFHIKEQLLTKSRSIDQLPALYRDIQLWKRGVDL